MKQIGLQYSTDEGATWSTALVLNCLSLRVDTETTEEQEFVALDQTQYKYGGKARYVITVNCASDNFNPAKSGGSNANLTNLNKFLRTSGLKRIYNANTTLWPDLDGYTVFNANPNTYYVFVDSGAVEFQPFDVSGTGGRKIRTVSFVLKTRGAYVL